MNKSDLPFQISKTAIRNLKKFVYRNKKYPFDFHKMKENSEYFYQNRQILKNVDDIKLLNEMEETSLDMSDEIIQTFIKICQNELCLINHSNAIQLQYLSLKFKVPQLTSITDEYIKENRKELLLQTFLFKQKFSNKNENETINFSIDTTEEEEIIIKNMSEYIKKDDLVKLSIPILDRLLHKYFSATNENEKNEEEIINFLFKCLDKHGRDASILFSHVDFRKQTIGTMNRLLHEYSDIFDFSMINSTLLQTTTEMASELKKMKEEYSNEFKEMKRIFKEEQQELRKIKEEHQKMIEKEEERRKEIENEFKNKIKEIEEEKNKQRKEFNEEIKQMKTKNNELIKQSEIQQMHKLVIELISREEFLNLSEESKNYAFNTIILQNQIKDKQNGEKSIKSTSLYNQITTLKNIINKTNDENDSIEFIKEIINQKSIKFEIIKSLYQNNILETSIINLMNCFDDISIELDYPSEYFEPISKILMKIEKENKNDFNKVKITIIISDIENIKYDEVRNKLIDKCIIGPSVKEIGFNAFKGSNKLASIELSNGIEKIGMNAFYECSSLKQINIPSSVTTIDSYAFESCSSMKSISLPFSIKSIGSKIFNGCHKILLSGNFDNFPDKYFKFNLSLKQIVIPSSVKTIGDRFFHSCESLELIRFEIPSSLTSISKHVFDGCISLTHISIPSSVKSIEEYAFYNCKSLVQVSISTSVIEIGIWAFENCSSLEQVSFQTPSSLSKIGYYAFYNCSSLKQITIPSSVKSIGNNAFDSCSLSEITLPCSINTSNLSITSNAIIKRI